MAGRLIRRRPPGPEARPIERLSPSLGASLSACPLSVAYRLDRRFTFLRRTSPAAALGNASHDLSEDVAHGAFDHVPSEMLSDALEEAWRQRLSIHEAALTRDHPEGAVPSPARWAGYEQTRVRLLDLLQQEVRVRQRNGAGSPINTFLAEYDLAPEGVPLHGRADRIERHGSEVDIVDLKTGWTLPEELQPGHRRQLLAYAYLWHAVHGEWPRRASIQRLDGRRLTFDVDPREAERVAADLVADLDEYNLRVAQEIAPSELASPSADVCRYCQFRVVCPPFFAAASPEWGWARKSVLGRVTDVRCVRNIARVDIRLEAGNVADVDTVHLINVPIECVPDIAARVAVIDAIGRGADLKLAWDSVICAWS